MKKILFIVGSLRKGSYNRQLAEKVAEIIEGRAEVSYLEYADIPYMNQDLEADTPSSIKRVREEVGSSDAIWIFTPEYNSYFPGGLKNLLDWLSRPLVPGDFSSGTALKGKPVTVSGVGGKNATKGARENLMALCGYMRMKPMEGNGVGGVLGGEAWITGNYSPDEATLSLLKEQAESFLNFIEE